MTDVSDKSHDLSLAFGAHVAAVSQHGLEPKAVGVGTPRTVEAEQTVEALQQSDLPYYWRDGQRTRQTFTSRRVARLALKRAMDLALSSIGLFALSPFLLAIAAAIKLTSEGPVLFRQERIGMDGRPFYILKFRTMFVDRCDVTGRAQTSLDDDRVTPIGRVLRNKSLDELPQLLNVIVGEMSLVGPRPHVAGMPAAGLLYETLVPYYSLRLSMKPGITGWAQVNGLRGPTTDPVKAKARVDYDLAYIQHFSIWLDLKIIVRTAYKEFLSGTGT